MKKEIQLTIFTPTYNRGENIKKAYEALKRQTCKEFEWLIIDDGSTDNTEQIVSEWIKNEQQFTIRYIYKENGGLHTGYNTAIANIDTELCVCVDSDDFMPEEAVESILNFWNTYGSEEYAGIVGLDYDLQGHVIGDPLPEQKSVNLIDLLVGKYPIVNGDRKNVVRTELYKQVAPMKSFPGEKNFNPHYMHLLISCDYDFLVMNHNLCYVDYQTDGMTASIFKQYRNSPNSFLEIRKLYLSFEDAPFKFIVKNTIHYISSSILAKKFLRSMRETKRKGLTVLCIPAGFAMSLLIRWKTRS